nr:1-acyl-sn-glycerol-3-phosphate acyltransferase [uncultured Glaciecola sp.]
MSSKFDEIRPYDNADLPHVLKQLVNNKEFISTLVAFRFAKWPQFTKPIFAYFIKRFISKKIQTTASLRDFQSMIEPYMQRMLTKTTNALTVTGIDTLDLSSPCVFISNHRDIALDPAFINWVLHINGQDTVRIAVGDNLLSKGWVADILRLNKCFVVQRSVEGRRAKLAAAKLLSEYIYCSLKNDKQHLWIAQREGRAKDGIDVTNPAIISMLSLNKPKEIDFSDYIANLRIVPVSISYEFDPCDVSKAKELCQAAKEGGYDKPDNEDMHSIVNGITGQKGRVHVHFGKLVGNQFENAKEVSAFIDQEILAGYQPFSTSSIALGLLNSEYKDATPKVDSASDEVTTGSEEPQLAKRDKEPQLAKRDKEPQLAKRDKEPQLAKRDKEPQLAKRYLESRLVMLNFEEQQKLLNMYANPLIRQQQQ